MDEVLFHLNNISQYTKHLNITQMYLTCLLLENWDNWKYKLQIHTKADILHLTCKQLNPEQLVQYQNKNTKEKRELWT